MNIWSRSIIQSLLNCCWKVYQMDNININRKFETPGNLVVPRELKKVNFSPKRTTKTFETDFSSSALSQNIKACFIIIDDYWLACPANCSDPKININCHFQSSLHAPPLWASNTLTLKIMNTVEKKSHILFQKCYQWNAFKKSRTGLW